MKLFKLFLTLMLCLVLVLSLIACDMNETDNKNNESIGDDYNATDDKQDENDDNGENDVENDENNSGNNNEENKVDASWKDKNVDEIVAMSIALFEKATSYKVNISVGSIDDSAVQSNNNMLVTGINPADYTDLSNLKASIEMDWDGSSQLMIFDGTNAYFKSEFDGQEQARKFKQPVSPEDFCEQYLADYGAEEFDEPAIPNMPLYCVESICEAFGKSEKSVGDDGKVIITFTELKEDQNLVEAYVENEKMDLEFERAFVKLYLNDDGIIEKLELSLKYSFESGAIEDPANPGQTYPPSITTSDVVELITIDIAPTDTVTTPADADEYQTSSPDIPESGESSSDSFGDGYDKDFVPDETPTGDSDNQTN